MQRFKKISIAFLLFVFVGSFGCGADDSNTHDSSIPYTIVDNAAATVSGTGYVSNNETATAYDSSSGFIVNLGTGSQINYAVGDNVSGNYDIYLEVSRAGEKGGFGTTPFSVSINGGEEVVPIIEYGFCNDEKTNIFEKGVFLCQKNTELNAGDTITVTALPGFVSSVTSSGTTTYTVYLPSLGDIRLYNPEADVATGHRSEIPAVQSASPAQLSGMKAIWIGSSVVYGLKAKGYSMADYLEQRQGLQCYKYAVSGTTMVDDSSSTATSFITRMEKIPADINPDFVVIQLSTNDAVFNKTVGVLSGSTSTEDLTGYDKTTIYGAIEYIIAYASHKWNCPVVFFTGSFFDGATYYNLSASATRYGNMITYLNAVKTKWESVIDFYVIDLWNNSEMTAIYNNDEWKTYMSDGVHPKETGYKTWWGPKFEESLISYLQAK